MEENILFITVLRSAFNLHKIITLLTCLGMFCMFGSCSDILPVAVCVTHLVYTLSVPRKGWADLDRCSGNTTFVTAVFSLRQSRMTPGRGW